MKDLLVTQILLFTIVILVSCNYSHTDTVKTQLHKLDTSAAVHIKSNRELYDSIKLSYDTLIPIFDGLFITYNQLDTAGLRLLLTNRNTEYDFRFNKEFYQDTIQKWGIIDSSGSIIVPFICDGAKAISDSTGIISVRAFDHMLDTGIPRYRYVGTCFKFNKNGIGKDWFEKFDLRIIHNGTHRHEFVITQGSDFYLPYEYRKRGRYDEPYIR